RQIFSKVGFQNQIDRTQQNLPPIGDLLGSPSKQLRLHRVTIHILRERRSNNDKQLLHILRRWRARAQPRKARGLTRSVSRIVLRLALAEIIEDRSVIQNASISVLDPLFVIG